MRPLPLLLVPRPDLALAPPAPPATGVVADGGAAAAAAAASAGLSWKNRARHCWAVRPDTCLEMRDHCVPHSLYSATRSASSSAVHTSLRRGAPQFLSAHRGPRPPPLPRRCSPHLHSVSSPRPLTSRWRGRGGASTVPCTAGPCARPCAWQSPPSGCRTGTRGPSAARPPPPSTCPS